MRVILFIGNAACEWSHCTHTMSNSLFIVLRCLLLRVDVANNWRQRIYYRRHRKGIVEKMPITELISIQITFLTQFPPTPSTPIHTTILFLLLLFLSVSYFFALIGSSSFFTSLLLLSYRWYLTHTLYQIIIIWLKSFSITILLDWKKCSRFNSDTQLS